MYTGCDILGLMFTVPLKKKTKTLDCLKLIAIFMKRRGFKNKLVKHEMTWERYMRDMTWWIKQAFRGWQEHQLDPRLPFPAACLCHISNMKDEIQNNVLHGGFSSLPIRLGTSWPIYVNVYSLHLDFSYFNFLGGYQWKKLEYCAVRS